MQTTLNEMAEAIFVLCSGPSSPEGHTCLRERCTEHISVAKALPTTTQRKRLPLYTDLETTGAKTEPQSCFPSPFPRTSGSRNGARQSLLC